MGEKHLTIIGHLEELRKVLLVSIIALIPTSVAGWFFKDYTLTLLLKPLKTIDPNFKLQILGPADKIFVDLKIAVFLGIILALPIIMWQLWSFILPALKQKEKHILGSVVPATVILFVSGVVFAYFTVFQIGVQFFFGYVSGAGNNVVAAYALKEYISFALTFLLPFGLVFELPIVILVLTRLGVVTPRFLAAKRKYALLIIFVIAAFLTPGPDVVSQFMMAAPMYILYEVSILLSYLVVRKQASLAELEEDVEITADSDDDTELKGGK
ncbi:MAG: twin-arginine translocase subunit TatC [Clostridia bacterium]|nr:twin-arginine translocase subunit TatC [Clostridia bacterium]